ncbi:MAG: amylo-alpha-1,6-glucosidase [Candidatus Bathycorpusculaceae bacterium]
MELPKISVNQKGLSNFEDAIQQEWLITNGLGGYASSTILGINTRKYHGLLVAAMRPPSDRVVCLAKLDEEVSAGKRAYALGANEFQNGIFPQGFKFLKEFSVAPFPRYVYSTEDVKVEKTIFMPNKTNATIILYRIKNNHSLNVKVKVKIFPIISCRYYHFVLDRASSPIDFIQKSIDNRVETQFNSPKVALIVQSTGGKFHEKARWIERVYYREESARGESCIDNYYQPGYFELEAVTGREEEFAVAAVADENIECARETFYRVHSTTHNFEALFERELERRRGFLTGFYNLHPEIPASDWLSWALLATSNFIVESAGQKESVVAGYFWFEAWGRDTFISLPGLMLVNGRFEDAKKVLLDFEERCEHGLIPNFIQDRTGEPSYNSVDASLWFANAVLQYLKYTGDFEFVQKRLWETLKSIVKNYEEGTAYKIHADEDGLLAHGPQLTWMDAEVDGRAITPRDGKAVEVQALWYNMLRIMQLLAKKFEDRRCAEEYEEMAERARRSFVAEFWNAEKNCLFDVVSEHGKDASLRPNQIVTVALDFTMLDREKSKKTVDVVHRELFTPFGLRTLARSDPRYRGVYVGDRRSRDSAYHNGTVWAWLQGPFTTAFLKANSCDDYRLKYALENFIAPLFREQVFKAGLGNISEIFDGDPPHLPRGCIAQAWSVAEPLRAYVEDVMQIRPKCEKEVMQILM